MQTQSTSNDRITQKLSPETKEPSKTNIIVIAITAVLVIVLIVALVLVVTKQSAVPEHRNVVVTPDNVEEIVADMQDRQVAAGRYEVTMNTTWNFDKGDSASSNAYVENSTANTNDVYFDIVRSDTGETIFASPTIPVGSHLENVTLDTPLDKGTYACVLTYHLLDGDGNAISKLSINLSIVINN